jgi:hypothetical protein
VAGGGTGSTSGSGTLGTGNPGHTGNSYQVTATPTLPLVQLSPQYMTPYSLIAKARNPEQYQFNLTGKEWTQFIGSFENRGEPFTETCDNIIEVPMVTETAGGFDSDSSAA